ncbi:MULTISPECIES: hypothetical protein [Rhodobacterales]|uniref:hypothetical protein n=1 Tax=Roseobacter sp. N2S TaxID=2663844 RepID=UPI0028547C6E|nr:MULTISPECIES: hypothetical protein [Rhodobacterales]MDR6265688.1 hypothetical protein [Roseobacter sp. N2S]
MARRLTYYLLVSCAAVMIALASITSASLMSPERGESEKLIAALAFGLSAEDICGEDGEPHIHDCPYCRLLSDTPTIHPVQTASLLLPHDGWQRLADLTRRAQSRNLYHAARAPPAQA